MSKIYPKSILFPRNKEDELKKKKNKKIKKTQKKVVINSSVIYKNRDVKYSKLKREDWGMDYVEISNHE